jgi:hypothetical protein
MFGSLFCPPRGIDGEAMGAVDGIAAVAFTFPLYVAPLIFFHSLWVPALPPPGCRIMFGWFFPISTGGPNNHARLTITMMLLFVAVPVKLLKRFTFLAV